MITLVITDRERIQPTSSQLKNATDLFELSVKERRNLYGTGNRGFVRAGLCDGQRCVMHKFLPDRRGCYCKYSGSDYEKPVRDHYKEAHIMKCSLNGENDTPIFGCDGYKPDYSKEHERARPEYLNEVVGRKLI